MNYQNEIEKINHLFEDLNKSLKSKSELQDIQEEVTKLFDKCQQLKNDTSTRYETLFDAVPCTISWISKDFTYIEVNKLLAETCNLKKQDFVGKTIGFHTNEKHFREFAGWLFSQRTPVLYKEIETQISGESRIFLVAGQKYKFGNEAAIIGLDITELARTRKKLNEMMEVLTYIEDIEDFLIELKDKNIDASNPLKSIESIRRIFNKI